MVTFVNLQTDVRSRLVEPTARYFTDAEIKRWINFGYHDFISRTHWAEKIVGRKIVAKQFEYDIPTDIVQVQDISFDDKYKLIKNDYVDLNANMGLNPTQKSNRPRLYFDYPWDKKVKLYPAPDANGASTAINVGGGISSSTTTITVDATAGFPTVGRILIDSEQILYQDASATAFLQCVRGDGFTTAATHADDAVVDLAKLQIYCTYDPPDLSADGDTPRINTAYHEALIHYGAHIGFQKKMKFQEAGLLFQEYIRIVDKANLDRVRQTQDRNPYIRDEDDYAFYGNGF